MKKVWLILLILVLVSAACLSGTADNKTAETPTALAEQIPTNTSLPKPTSTIPPVIESTPTMPPADILTLSPFTVDLSGPFASGVIEPASFVPEADYAGEYQLPVSSGAVANPEVLAGLTNDQRAFLYKNGFVVIHSQEESFLKIREEVAWFQGQPYFLTVDSALHAFHLTFDEMLKEVEKELNPQMAALVSATLDVVLDDLAVLQGSEVEEDARIAAEYLFVALRLFDPTAEVPAEFEGIVSDQLDLIYAGDNSNDGYSLVVPDFKDDYGAYKPVGHYAGDEELEKYFRGMTWLGRVHFNLKNEDSLRTPLIITSALRRADLGDVTGAERWADIHELLTFMIGPMDDAGPAEYAMMMDEVYGTEFTVEAMKDDALLSKFVAMREEIPAPQINSTFVNWVSRDMEGERGWRFMGQRFTMDGLIFQNLIYDLVEQNGVGERREIPSGLDVAAAFGSEPAYQALADVGMTNYPNYDEQLALMQEAVVAQTKEEWQSKFYDSWLYAFFPILAEKDSVYPPFMQTEPWAYREINAVLGSWAQLKRDTILYTKMPEAAGGGGPPFSGPAPGYVEPNPEAFYRLGYLADMLYWGLEERGYSFYYGFRDFSAIGDIAAKELRGEPLDQYDYEKIEGCMGFHECIGTASQYSQGGDPRPVPVIAAVSGAGDSVLEVGVGYVDRMYVIVPIDGQLVVSQGGVFSYYEFDQPRIERLTDEDWKDILVTNAPSQPGWTSNFVLPGGEPTFSTAFRVGDVYIITEEGADLNLRESASTDAAVLHQYEYGEYLTIIDGPVVNEGYTWWKVQSGWGTPVEGWVVENQAWFERGWGQ